MKSRFRTVARIVAVVALAALPATMMAVPAHAEGTAGELTIEFSPETGPSVGVTPPTADLATLVATVTSTIEGASFELGSCDVSTATDTLAEGSGAISLSDCAGTYADMTLRYDPESGTTDLAVSGAAGAFRYRWPRLVCVFVFTFPPPRFVLRCRWAW